MKFFACFLRWEFFIKSFCFFVFCFSFHCLLAQDHDGFLAGKDYAKAIQKEGIKEFKEKDLEGFFQKVDSSDYKIEAYLQDLQSAEESSLYQELLEIGNLNPAQDVLDREAYFLDSEEQFFMAENQNSEENSVQEGEEIVKELSCYRKGEPVLQRISSDLKFDFEEKPEKRQRKCLGHRKAYKSFSKRQRALDYKTKKESDFANDRCILTSKVWTEKEKRNFSTQHRVYASFYHKPDSRDCLHFQELVTQKKETKIKKEYWTEVKLQKGCKIIEEHCLRGAKKRNFSELEIERPCWKKQYVALCEEESDDTCPLFGVCEKKASRCLRNFYGKCLLFEDLFICRDRKSKNEPYLLQEYSPSHLEEHSENDRSYVQAIAALKVFEDLQAELGQSGDLSVFSGNCFRCKKSRLGKALFDCCSSMQGFSMSAGLREHCSAEEISLSEKRAAGLCVDLGAFFDHSLIARQFQTSCCFSSKLARILHEQGRRQLNLAWGSAEKPLCRGFSFEEISKIDFSKIDFSEVIDDEVLDKTIVKDRYDGFVPANNLEDQMKKLREKDSGAKF